MVENGYKWSRMGENGLKWVNKAENWLKLSKIGENGRKGMKMTGKTLVNEIGEIQNYTLPNRNILVQCPNIYDRVK